MSLNNWLCKHFDREKKRYVTISDIAEPLIDKILDKCLYFGAILFIFIVVSFFLATVQNMTLTESERTFIGVFVFFINVWIIPIETIIILAIFFTFIYFAIKILERIGEIKIAKCPLKEQEETK